MGYAMASNVRQKMPKSSTLYINDINASACQRFQAEYSSHGPIEIVSTARQAAENAQVLISIVPGAEDVKKVYLDAETGIIAARKDSERIMLECSTIDVESTKEVGRKVMDKELGVYVDAPVSVSNSPSPLEKKPRKKNKTALKPHTQTNNPPGRRPRRPIRHPLHANRPPPTHTHVPTLPTSAHHTKHARLPPKILLPAHPRQRPHRQDSKQLPLGHHSPRDSRSPRNRHKPRSLAARSVRRDQSVHGPELDVRSCSPCAQCAEGVLGAE